MTRPLNSLCVVVVLILSGGAASLAEPLPAQFRGFWADIYKPGFRSQKQIDDMIARAVLGNIGTSI